MRLASRVIPLTASLLLLGSSVTAQEMDEMVGCWELYSVDGEQVRFLAPRIVEGRPGIYMDLSFAFDVPEGSVLMTQRIVGARLTVYEDLSYSWRREMEEGVWYAPEVLPEIQRRFSDVSGQWDPGDTTTISWAGHIKEAAEGFHLTASDAEAREASIRGLMSSLNVSRTEAEELLPSDPLPRRRDDDGSLILEWGALFGPVLYLHPVNGTETFRRGERVWHNHMYIRCQP